MSLSGKEKFSYGLGAVGKDMVYMLSASYILYYYQDILGVNAVAMGIILLVARVFDAFNDPFMGVIVAKTLSLIHIWAGGLCGGYLYSLGCDLYHDGYSFLVHDTGIYSQRKRA